MGGTKRKNERRWLLEDEKTLPAGSDLLLHVCCAPCSAGSLRRLCELFTVRMYFANPNIHPEAEYDRRLDAARQLAAGLEVPLESAPYDPAGWSDAVRGLEELDEGGERCAVCIEHRLRATARRAAELGSPFFSSTLTISPRKSPEIVNRAGMDAGREAGVRFLRCDLKKNEGFLESVRVSEELGLYRQHYCGCVHSMPENRPSWPGPS